MNCWINIHHPPVEDEPRRNQCRVYLQRKNEHLIDRFKEGDYVLIYETKNLYRQWVEVVSNGNRRAVKLGRGRGGIIALVQIASSFRRGRWSWNGIPFIGSFDTAEIHCTRAYVPLNEINEARSRKMLSSFNPRINGGVRRLGKKEFRVMVRLLGFVVKRGDLI